MRARKMLAVTVVLLLSGCADGGLVGHLTSETHQTEPTGGTPQASAPGSGPSLQDLVLDPARLPSSGEIPWSKWPVDVQASLASCVKGSGIAGDTNSRVEEFSRPDQDTGGRYVFYQVVTRQISDEVTKAQGSLLATKPYQECAAKRFTTTYGLDGSAADQVDVYANASRQGRVGVLSVQASTSTSASRSVVLSHMSARSELYFPRLDPRSVNDQELVRSATREASLLLERQVH